jgi:hypothetical protein
MRKVSTIQYMHILRAETRKDVQLWSWSLSALICQIQVARLPPRAEYPLVFHGFLKQASELFPLFIDLVAQIWSEHQHSFLRNRAFDQLVNVLGLET